MKTYSFELINVPNYIQQRFRIDMPRHMELDGEDQGIAIRKYMILVINAFGDRLHEFETSTLAGPTFVIREGLREKGTYTIVFRPNSARNATLVNITDRYGIMVSNICIFVGRKSAVAL